MIVYVSAPMADKGSDTLTFQPRATTHEATHTVLVFEPTSSFVVSLPRDGILTIGRDERADLRLRDETASRQHAKLIIANGEVRVADLGSHNGTLLNGARIEATARLGPGDSITVGACTLVLRGGSPPKRLRSILEANSFQQRLGEEISRALEYERPLAVAVLAADAKFKIEDLVQVLDQHLRDMDVAGWLAPHQLALLLPELDAALAASLCSSLCDSAEAVEPTARIGLSICPADGTDGDALLAQARSTAASTPPGKVLSNRTIITRHRFGDQVVILADPTTIRLYELLKNLAKSDLPVLIHGETGTGKENAALAVHHWSAREGKPFIAINCAAIPTELAESELFGHEKGAFSGANSAKPGLLESAEGGTVFLDEIGELDGNIQAKLLRVIETKRAVRVGAVRERQLDFRIVAATNRNLEREVGAGKFRQDLYFRLATTSVVLPALRERPREVAILANEFLASASERRGRAPAQLSAAATHLIEGYSWPGNVRELKNLMEYLAAIVEAWRIEPWHLPERYQSGRSSDSPLPVEEGTPKTPRFLPIGDEIRDLERTRMTEVLNFAGGNQTRAAALIGMPLRTFVTKMKQYGLQSQWRS